jgi:FkbM family methyltransferase
VAVKLKEFLYLLGLRPRPRTYGHVIESHTLPTDGRIEVARWLHPGAYRTIPTQAEIDQLRLFLKPGDVAIDIGAHTGDTTIPIALAVGPSGAVLALEPNRYVYPVLERNAALNPGKTRIIPLPVAAMRAGGRYEFQYGGPGYCNGGYHEGVSRWLHGSAFTLEIEGRNLAEVLAGEYPSLVPRLRFIKVDTEGFDLAVLETIEPLLRDRRPYLRVEMFNLRKSIPGYRNRLYEFLAGLGYAIHRVEPGALAGEPITAGNLLQWNHYDVFCVPSGSPSVAPPAPSH